MGHPHIHWTPELEQSIIDWIADGKTLREFCRQDGMPSHDAVQDHEEVSSDFKRLIARARLRGEDVIAQECLYIADNTQEGVIITEKPDGSEETKRADMIEHRKLRIHTRLQLLAKWNPRKYGDRVAMTGADGGPIELRTVLVPVQAVTARERPALKPDFGTTIEGEPDY